MGNSTFQWDQDAKKWNKIGPAKATEGGEGTWQIAEDENGKAILFNSKTAQTRPAPPGIKPKSTDAGPGGAFDRASAEAASKDVETARGGDFRYRSMSGSLPAAQKGDQQAMLNLLTNHIGMTLGMQKGARITKDILREAQHSVPWLQGVEAKWDKDGYLSGAVLTKPQMGQMMHLAEQQRANSWAQAIESARQGGVADKLKIPADVRIVVAGRDGKLSTLPAAQLSQAEDQGYTLQHHSKWRTDKQRNWICSLTDGPQQQPAQKPPVSATANGGAPGALDLQPYAPPPMEQAPGSEFEGSGLETAPLRVLKGAAKGLGSTGYGLASIVGEGAHALAPKIIPAMPPKPSILQTDPNGIAENAGYVGEQIGEAMVPGLGEEKAGMEAGKLLPALGEYGPKVGRTATTLRGARDSSIKRKAVHLALGAALGGAGGVAGELGRSAAPSIAERRSRCNEADARIWKRRPALQRSKKYAACDRQRLP